MAKACFWVGTLNNYTPGEEDYPSWLKEHCDYAIIGKEVGESGTPHLQCVFKFKDRIRITGIKKLDPVATWSRFHMEPMKGQLHQAIDYCKKEGSWVEIGDRKCPHKSHCVQCSSCCGFFFYHIARDFWTNETCPDWTGLMELRSISGLSVDQELDREMEVDAELDLLNMKFPFTPFQMAMIEHDGRNNPLFSRTVRVKLEPVD